MNEENMKVQDEQNEIKKQNIVVKEIISWVKYLIVALVIGVAVTSVIKPTIVSGVSMYSTLHDHDYLIINRLAYDFAKPHRGDIVVFNSNLPQDKVLIKRVIATEGQKVKIKNGQVFIDDKLINEPYLHGLATQGNIETVVPAGKMFVMGDNRPNSLDSRYPEVGFVDLHTVIGKVMFRLYPFKPIQNH